jgi:putative endonuclease
MRDGKVVVFVEVRFRASNDFMTPEQSIDVPKQRRVIAAARHFLAANVRGPVPPCRFDVVSVTRRHYRFRCRWTRDAFQS